ncbi:protein of unknown function [uncultured Sphingopyxis sp.]|uniref:Uncharacterized protein n=1 Tax=uncultured Sphingopyxis sp. TaxID=310581 RepID=A0A1Y5Q093_9SPHN|nr:protein of unknown function [uncultured Sphingopyxis sp.]
MPTRSPRSRRWRRARAGRRCWNAEYAIATRGCATIAHAGWRYDPSACPLRPIELCCPSFRPENLFPTLSRHASVAVMAHSLSPLGYAAPAQSRATGIIIPEGNDKFDNFGIKLRGHGWYRGGLVGGDSPADSAANPC